MTLARATYKNYKTVSGLAKKLTKLVRAGTVQEEISWTSEYVTNIFSDGSSISLTPYAIVCNNFSDVEVN